MAYTPMTPKSSGDIPDENDWNDIVDNFGAGVPDIFTTKGDLAVASAADAAGRLAVGSNGQLLTADSAQSLGLKWATPSDPCYARYKASGTTSVANTTWTILDFAASVLDSDSAVITGASWKFTVPTDMAGYYLVMVNVYVQSSANWGQNEQCSLGLYKNGTLNQYLSDVRMQYTGTYGVYLSGWGLISLADADYIDVRMYQSSGAAVTMDSDGDMSHVSIMRLF